MRKLLVFLQVSLDGYFAKPDGDISWAHRDDEEFDEFTAQNAQGGGAILFGRKTYDMMVRYWPTPEAKKAAPQVAESMNRMPKYVVSKTLQEPAWQNTTLLKGDLVKEVRKLKQEGTHDITVLGSASVAAELADAGLVDEFQFVVNPVLLGAGRTLFAGVKQPVELKLTKTRSFKNGVVASTYEPVTNRKQ